MAIAAVPDLLQRLIGADHSRREMAQGDQERRALRRRLRTLCEDLDELLGQVGDAVRRDRVEEAAPLLGRAVVIATQLADGLPSGASGLPRSARHIAESVLDEADVQRTLGLVEELDAELDHRARGCGADRAAALADSLVTEIEDLTGAAASGRARPRTGPHRLVDRPRRPRATDWGGGVRRNLWTNPHGPAPGDVMTTTNTIDGRLYRAVNFLNNVDGDVVRYEDAGVSDADLELLRTEVARLRGELADALAGTTRVLT